MQGAEWRTAQSGKWMFASSLSLPVHPGWCCGLVQGLALGLHPLSPPEDMGCRETQGMVPLAWTLERSKLAAQGTAGVQGARLWCGA